VHSAGGSAAGTSGPVCSFLRGLIGGRKQHLQISPCIKTSCSPISTGIAEETRGLTHQWSKKKPFEEHSRVLTENRVSNASSDYKPAYFSSELVPLPPQPWEGAALLGTAPHQCPRPSIPRLCTHQSRRAARLRGTPLHKQLEMWAGALLSLRKPLL